MKYKKRLALFSGLIATLLILPLGAGCMRTSVAAQGWSGVTGADGRLFYLTTVAGTGGGGFLGCNASSPLSQLLVLSGSDGGVLNTINFQESTVFYGASAVSGEFAYIPGYNGRLYRVNVVTGGTPQSVAVGSGKPQPIVGGVAVADGKVFVGSVDGRLYAFDASLERLWDFKTGDVIWSTPVVSGNTVYIGSFDKNIYAIDIATGNKKWSYALQGAVMAAPVVSGGMVYVASLDRHIYAFDAESGMLVWQFPAEGAANAPSNWFWATPVLVDGKLYAPNTDGRVYVIDAQNGSLTAELKTSGSILSSPVTVDGRVVLVTEEGDIYSINTVTQQFEGSAYRLRTVASASVSNAQLTARASLATLNGMVYVQTSDPVRVFEFNPATREAQEIGTRQSTSTAPPTSSTNTTAVVTTTVTVTVTTTG